MAVTTHSRWLREVNGDPRWQLFGSVWLFDDERIRRLTSTFEASGPYMSLKSWSWRPGRLSGLMCDELGAVVGDQAVNGLLNLEGHQLSIFGPPE